MLGSRKMSKISQIYRKVPPGYQRADSITPDSQPSLRCLKGLQLLSPFGMFPSGHIRVTRSQEGSPSSDYIFGALGLGEDQEVAGSTAHVMY